MIGQTIAHYTILEKLGEGGMGVVYKAEDTRLKRTVALKFLPPHLSASDQDKNRFMQEAQAAASLNHPNICTIHGIDEHEGQLFFAMEFVDGQTLREKMRSLSFKQAIDIAIQVADGLAAAHDKGIVHRDIKPENIMVRKDGMCQVMDFGLAKLRSASSTLNRLTKEGSTIGTAGYMSPEQVLGQDADHRSDIFSFGVLVYEMFTRQLPFRGVHETAVAYEIVNVDPAPMTSTAPEIDPQLDAVVLDCLEKDPTERCQSIAEVARDLRKVKRDSTRQRHSRITASRPAVPSTPAEPSAVVTLKKLRFGWWTWSTAFFFLTTILSVVYFYATRTSATHQTIRSFIPLPANTALNNLLGGGHVALSHDGEKVAFIATDSLGKSNLWVRSLNALNAQMLLGTEGALFPFWSPDDKMIAFFADSKLKKIDVAGGTPFTICDGEDPRGGTWGAAGIIVFSPQSGGKGIFQVSAAGGLPSQVTQLDSARKESTHRWPFFLPDGDHFLFFIRTTAAGSGSEADSICVGSIATKDVKHLVHGISDAAYAKGQLLFMRETALMAQPFDPATLAVTGEPSPVVQQIQYDSRFSRAVFSVSTTGLLIYQYSGTRWARELALFDEKGAKISSFGQPEIYTNARMSKDGKRIAMELVDLQSHNIDLWIHEMARGVQTRFTFDAHADISPLWSPDGNEIVFSSDRKAHHDLYVKKTSGSAPEILCTDVPSRDKFASDWSTDGKYILFSATDNARSKTDLWILPMRGDRKPVAFLQTEFDEYGGTFSPDMRWIAYVSNESGRPEVYVRPFVLSQGGDNAATSGKWQVSMDGGAAPRWRNDGKALFYARDNKIMVAEVRTEGLSFEVLRVTQYMDLQAKQQIRGLDISPDGRRILGQITLSQEKNTPLTLVINWDEELKKK